MLLADVCRQDLNLQNLLLDVAKQHSHVCLELFNEQMLLVNVCRQDALV